MTIVRAWVAVTDTQGKPFYTIRYDYIGNCRRCCVIAGSRIIPRSKRIRDRERNVHLSISAGLQVKAVRRRS